MPQHQQPEQQQQQQHGQQQEHGQQHHQLQSGGSWPSPMGQDGLPLPPSQTVTEGGHLLQGVWLQRTIHTLNACVYVCVFVCVCVPACVCVCVYVHVSVIAFIRV
jgi:hypothetical protein